MRKVFLKELVERYPNDLELGTAIRLYYWILKENPKLSKEQAEEAFRFGYI